jgi:hypothetical protein
MDDVPQRLGLGWANRTRPTAYGDLVVSWAFEGTRKLSMEVSNPRRTNGTVHLPTYVNEHRYTILTINYEMVSVSDFAPMGGIPFT